MANDPFDGLRNRLDQLNRAMARPADDASPPSVAPSHPGSAVLLGGSIGLAATTTLLVVAIATHRPALIAVAIALGVFSGIAVLAGAVTRALRTSTARPHIGMGSSVSATARVEAGATIGWGATVRAGAVVKRGAVIEWGATVGAGAVIEEGAIVSWGASVRAGATVGARAVVGWGATVAKNAQLPAGMRMSAGTNWRSGMKEAGAGHVATSVPASVSTVAVDPRAARIDAACARLETELQQASPQIREQLGSSAETIRVLRQTCHGLIAREKALRAETSPESLGMLDQERQALERRISSEGDELVRRSLSSAVAAIVEQRRQRELMGKSADRLEAELTRLIWTLDGMGAQLVRLKTAGAEIAAPGGEVVRSAKQLQDEIGAIADALEEIAREDQARSFGEEAPAPVSDAAGEGQSAPADRERGR